MKLIHKILSSILTLAMLLGLILPAAAAEKYTGALIMTPDSSTVDAGDTVYLTITVSDGFATRGSGMTITYDPAYLQPDTASSQPVQPFAIHGPLTVGEDTALRISFFPGETEYPFAAGGQIAVVAFKALAPCEKTTVKMTASYLYDNNLAQIDMASAENVDICIQTVPVTGISLDAQSLTLETEETTQLTESITPENATDKTVIWSSSDESVVIVTDGVLTGVGVGTAVITAKAGDFTAQCTVTVTLPPNVGYTLTMPEDTTKVYGETVPIPVTIGNMDVDVFSAFDISLAYDPQFLELTSTEIDGLTITAENGTVNVLGYGEDQKVDTAPFTLTFKTLKTGETEIPVLSARVDNSGNAVTENAPKATLIDGETKITIGGYPVSLPDGFGGETVAQPGEDYTFTVPTDHYDYTVSVTVGGESVEPQKDEDGGYTIPADSVTGEIVVSADKTGKIFDVKLGTDMTGAAQAQYMSDYTATLNRDSGYSYAVSVKIGGEAYTGFGVNGDSYTIPGQDITGDIVFTVTKAEIIAPPTPVTYHNITFEGTGAGAAEGNVTTVKNGSSYTFQLDKESGYRYSVSYTMDGGDPITIRPDADGNYTIPNVTGNVVITVQKESDQSGYSVEVYEYISLDEKTMYLVLVQGELDDSKVFAYDGSAMHYSTVYNAWCILTVEADTLTESGAGKRISSQTGVMNEISSADCDVNMTGLVDINDAQLVYDMYKGIYEDFAVINMHRFLNADVNADKKVTVNDAAAVVSAIK